jgi:hypothetical protein
MKLTVAYGARSLSAVVANATNPSSRQVGQGLAFLPARQSFRLDAGHLAGGCGLTILGPISNRYRLPTEPQYPSNTFYKGTRS